MRRRASGVRARATGVAALLAVSLGLAAAGPVVAADPVTFGTPTATSAFAKSLDFRQPVELAAKPTHVEILLRTPDSNGPNVVDVETTSGSGKQVLTFDVQLDAGHIVPNTTFEARWRVTDADGKTWLGPPVTHTYADDRVEWRSLKGDIVTVHWYQGNAAFGQRALGIGDKAVAETAALLGVTESDPIDFYIYADEERFREALGPATRENVGGQAHADIRTMFALITPAEIDDSWVEVVVPHELMHLVFATAIENPYHEPPHWLNEGLAVYLSEGYKSTDRNAVEGVARDGTIIPLEGLVGAFPTTRDRFFLAYAESVSAVNNMVATYGRDALVALIRSYATGVTDDEAFSAALGVDAAGFEAGWLDGLGAAPPVRHGPQPAPGGPVPEGWNGPAVVPGSSAPPISTPGSPRTGGGRSNTGLLIVLLVAAAMSAIIIGLAVTWRRRLPRA